MCLLPPICVFCKHFRAESTGDEPDCAAFAEIPDSIFRGEIEHRQPYPGDGGILFELDPAHEAEFAELVEIRLQLANHESSYVPDWDGTCASKNRGAIGTRPTIRR